MIRNHEWPPNIDTIASFLPNARNPGTIFAYGEDVYNPFAVPLPYALQAHESIHQARQLDVGVTHWWNRYLNEPDFRYNEELLAHIAEYMTQCPPGSLRNLRRLVLKATARRLAAPLYGYTVSLEKAEADIKKGIR